MYMLIYRYYLNSVINSGTIYLERCSDLHFSFCLIQIVNALGVNIGFKGVILNKFTARFDFFAH